MAELLNHFGAAVLHSLWQGALILAIVAVFRQSIGDRPHLSYLAGMAGLVAAFLAFLGTLAWLVANGATEPLSITDAASAPVGVLPALSAPPAAAGLSLPTSGLPILGLPTLGLLWAVGFFVLTLQAMYAFARTRCYATLGLSEPDPDWTARFAALVGRAGVTTQVRLRVSALVQSPVTLGTLRPLVLVPAGFLTQLPAAQIEAILLHELAHIRRHDFAFGLIQTAIRTTLYFNPAVWLLSRWASEDREQACDDEAVTRMSEQRSGAVELAKGLASLRLSLAPNLAMAANDRSGPLMARLQRLAGRPASPRGLDKLSALGIGAALVGATLFATTSVAHPPEYPHDIELPDTVVAPDAPEVLIAPPAPPVVSVDVGVPPVEVIPPLPPLRMDMSADEFEDSMEDWSERMEEWGESFGESIEENMEAWGEQMEDWGDSLEARGARVEALANMSDRELRALGLDRDDVEASAESFGLDIAESVIESVVPEFVREEALADIRRQRAELDEDALRRVEKAQAGNMRGPDANTDTAERLRANAERRRAEAESRRAEADARRKASLERRKAERAERDAARKAQRAERDARRKAEAAQRRAQAPDPQRPVVLGDRIAAEMAADGLLDRTSDDLSLTLKGGTLKLNRRKITGETRNRYMSILSDYGIGSDDTVELKRRGTNNSLSIQRG